MRIYRLDTFVIPQIAFTQFTARVAETHELLRQQPGFVRDFILEQPDDGDRIRLLTLVEWEDETSMAAAGEAVHAMRARSGFDPGVFVKEFDITADFRVYHASVLPSVANGEENSAA